MKYDEALKTMCERCSVHDMCEGTGCEPRRLLNELVSKEEAQKPIEVITTDNEYIITICPHCHQVIDRNYSEWDEVYNNPEGELK